MLDKKSYLNVMNDAFLIDFDIYIQRIDQFMRAFFLQYLCVIIHEC